MDTQQHQGYHHVVMFPWLAFGHMLPFLELSKRLASKDVSISFISTPSNIKRLFPTIPSDLSHLINLVELSLPSTGFSLIDNEGCEATVDLPNYEHVQVLKKAYDGLQEPFEEWLLTNTTTPPQLILLDFLPCWIPDIAAKFGIPCAYFGVYSAAALAFVGPPSLLKRCSCLRGSPPSSCMCSSTSFVRRTNPEDFIVSPDWIPFPSTVAFPVFQSKPVSRNLYVPDKTGKSSGDRLATTLEKCDFVVVRSCKEFEGEYVNVLEKIYQKPVVSVGLLPPPPPPPPTPPQSQHTLKTWYDTFRWLDKQAPRSVVFVGFGSEYKLTKEQVHELALGLKLSALPFIWVLKSSEHQHCLPTEINDRVLVIGDRDVGLDGERDIQGLVSIGWAPQLEILAHPAIGGCLFHSGWGSIIESLCYGHTLILMPMIFDQGLNSRLLVDKGIGMEVERNEDGSFTKDAVAKAIRLAMLEPDGESLRTKAMEMKSIVANHQLHDTYIQGFIQYMTNYKKKLASC